MLPALPFFALSDFGQMLVFYGVYILLFFITVRRTPLMVYGSLMSLLFLPIFYFGIGLPHRIKLRFYLWWNLWVPPAQDVAWWQPFFIEIQKAYHGIIISNADAWFDQSSQLAQGLFGITRGHFFGTGLGLGFPEVVPVSDSDFIYAAIGEELGLLGGIILLAAMLALIFSGIRTAIESRDMFTKLLAAGLTGFLGLQAIVNIGGVIRLLPMTGITLPFVSHGGSSLVTSFVMVGILLAISHRNEIERMKEKKNRDAAKEEAGVSSNNFVQVV
jgi:cell division protein FtsW (lipid II flippase)